MLLKKLYMGQGKKSAVISTSPREGKYSTRIKTRAQEQLDSSNNEDKKNAINRKIKDKEAAAKKPQVVGAPGMQMPMGQVPFQMVPNLTGQNMPQMYPLISSQKYILFYLEKTATQATDQQQDREECLKWQLCR